MNFELQKEDILNIGYGVENETDNTLLVAFPYAPKMESAFLREVLKCFGDYSITKIESEPNKENEISLSYHTNLPWAMYSELKEAQEKEQETTEQAS